MRDQLRQAQEERDDHLKTISSLKQVNGPSMAKACCPAVSRLSTVTQSRACLPLVPTSPALSAPHRK